MLSIADTYAAYETGVQVGHQKAQTEFADAFQRGFVAGCLLRQGQINSLVEAAFERGRRQEQDKLLELFMSVIRRNNANNNSHGDPAPPTAGT